MARLPNLRSLFSRARDTAPALVAEVAADRQAAGLELLEAQRGVEAAQAAFDAGLLDPTADRRALDDARRDAGLRFDAAKALCGAFATKAIEAQNAERQAELDRLVAEADATQAAFRELVENDMPAISSAVRAIMRAGAVAGLARETANQALAAAEAAEPRPPVEAFRAVAGRPERTLRTERFEGWCQRNGDLASYDGEIIRQHDGSGFLRRPGATHSKRYLHRRLFERIEVLTAEPARIPPTLAEALSIPGLRAGDTPIWEPIRDATPVRVLAALDRMERQREPDVDTRQPRIVVRAVGPVEEVAKPAHVSNLSTT